MCQQFDKDLCVHKLQKMLNSQPLLRVYLNLEVVFSQCNGDVTLVCLSTTNGDLIFVFKNTAVKHFKNNPIRVFGLDLITYILIR